MTAPSSPLRDDVGLYPDTLVALPYPGGDALAPPASEAGELHRLTKKEGSGTR